MKDLFSDIHTDEMVLAVPSLKIKGKAKDVFSFLDMLANTKPLQSDFEWWSVRADILSRDRDLQDCPKISARLN